MDVYMCVCVCMCVYMYIYVCICICIYICICLYITCMCSLFHLALRNGGFQLVYENACCLAWGVIFHRRKDRGVVCVFSIFKAGGSVCVCVCVYTHTHTQSFPRKNAERLKNSSHETESLSETVHGCRILPYLAYNRCASQERATQCRDFTRSAPGITIFLHFLPPHEPHSLG